MTPRRIAMLALAAALGACTTPTRQIDAIVGPDLSPLDRECRDEARRDPTIRQTLARQANIDVGINVVRTTEMRNQLEEQAFRDCLRRRGAPLPGGVERVGTPTNFRWPSL